MKKLLLIFALLLPLFSTVEAQTKPKTRVLVSSTELAKRGMILVRIKKLASICFAKVSCKERPADLTYGLVRTTEQPDWFMVGVEDPVRTIMIDLGLHSWKDKIKPQELEPYPKLNPGESRKPTVDIAFRKSDPGLGDASSIAIERQDVISEHLDPGDIESTSSEILKAIQGHMYLVHVKDNTDDFYVHMRVDKIVRRQSVRISWKRVSNLNPK